MRTLTNINNQLKLRCIGKQEWSSLLWWFEKIEDSGIFVG